MKSRRIWGMVVCVVAVLGGTTNKSYSSNYDIYKSDIENRMGGAHAITFTQDASIFEVVLKDGPTTIQVSKAADKISAVKIIWQKQFGNEVLVPSLTTTQRDAFAAVKGMRIFNSTLNKYQIRENGSWDSLAALPIAVADHATGTDGTIPTWDTVGNPTTFGPGTVNQYVASQGAGAEPIFKSILDEDDMVSDSATDVATQQSIKKYVDDNAGAPAQMVIVVDEKASGTNGGTFTQDDWRTRDLTVLRVNDDSIASLSSNQITLPAGTYECFISAPAFLVNRHMSRLQNITATSTIITGQTADAASANGSSIIQHKFTLSVTSALEIQDRCQTTRPDTGFGFPAGFGVVETYTIAVFRKVN